jgi:Flp pilus assembly protein TadG
MDAGSAVQGEVQGWAGSVQPVMNPEIHSVMNSESRPAASPRRLLTEMRPRRLIARACRVLHIGRRGQALVEMALVTPVLLLLLAGAIDLGRAWYSQITIVNAAREGALEAAHNPDLYQAGQPCSDANMVVCRAMREAEGSFVTVEAADVSMTCNAACVEGTSAAPNTASVRVEGEFSLLTPILTWVFGGQTVTIDAVATATIRMTPTIGAVPIATPTPTPTPSATPSPTATPSGSPGGPTPSPTATATPTPTPAPCVVPTASFNVSPTSGQKNSTVFTVTSTSSNVGGPHCNPVISWSWGDGAFSSGSTAQHIYDKRGTYTITLVVSNTAGNSAPVERTVNVTN